MGFQCNCGGYKHIQKQKLHKQTELPENLDFLRMFEIADDMEPETALLIILALEKLRDRINSKQVEEMIISGEIAQIEDIIPFNFVEDDLQGLVDQSRIAMIAAGNASVKSLPSAASSLAFDEKNPRIARFLQRNIGALIVSINEDTRQVVHNVIRRSTFAGVTPRQTAKTVKNIIGLTPKMEIALFNFRTKQGEDIKDPVKLERLVQRKRDRMIEVRANAIARTEMTRAVNAGQVETWHQAADLGLIERTKSRKTWVAIRDGRTSQICNELDGQSVLLDEVFWSSVVGGSFDHPPAHVNCRSGLIIEFD